MSEGTPATPRTEILVARRNGTAEVRVVGRGTYACSPALRDFTTRQIEEGVTTFAFDLSDCPTVDSTFMGLLAALVVRNRPKSVSVEIVRAGERTRKQLVSLGLENLFEFTQRGCEGETWTPIGAPSPDAPGRKRDLRQTMRESHEALGQVDPANVPLFSGVMDALGEDSTTRTEDSPGRNGP